MKKILVVSLIAVLAVCLVGCNNNNDLEVDNPNNIIENSGDVLSGDNNDNVEDNNSGENNEIPEASELETKINTIVEKAEVAIRAPMTMGFTAESAFTYVGLTEDEFNSNVEEAVAYESMIMPSNSSFCLLKLKDTANVAEIKKAVIDNCDPNKWICAFADKCIVVDSGNYVMLVMSTEENCTALQSAFEAEFGTIGEVLSK